MPMLFDLVIGKGESCLQDLYKFLLRQRNPKLSPAAVRLGEPLPSHQCQGEGPYIRAT